MMKALKIFYYVLRELVFDNKEEYDFNSAKFNARKFIITIMMMLSFLLNGWMLYRFSDLALQHVALANACTRTEEEKSSRLTHLIGEWPIYYLVTQLPHKKDPEHDVYSVCVRPG